MSNMIWHNDGHKISILLDKQNVSISGIHCPFETNPDADCQNDGLCSVKWFLERYGFDCNVGVVSMQPELEIAWAIVGNINLGLDSCQVWTIPVNDEFFSAWLLSQNGDSLA